ncbi:cupin domain-containing protein [uncultured Methylobacterium sp.]|jgi:mannose-6-phosphate isomerase-like protein (cupin superfamily)|uniref:cupin domain-containing protein n=1 Tax=uncultured Methylobacterium sp. TaxID=157278 RepID=UPI0026277BAE|nr:cupin domain-containing protein [uncultured Methylobacterium sp.]
MQTSLDFAKEFERLAREGLRESTTELGGVAVRLARVAGGVEGRWDHHAGTAETAVVWSGDFSVEFRDGTVHLGPGQCCVVPMGAEHRGLSQNGAEIVLFTQPAG